MKLILIQESYILIDDIKNSIKENNISKWQQDAMKLKGMSDNMRIDALKDHLSLLSQTDDIEVAKDVLSSIADVITKISKIGDK